MRSGGAVARAWGQELCLDLLRSNVGIGVNEEMIRASLGEPNTVDNEDVSTSSIAYRWVYRSPGRGPIYIWFRDDKVDRIRR